eukprot:1560660-Prorocentrum_lima.AAC.1
MPPGVPAALRLAGSLPVPAAPPLPASCGHSLRQGRYQTACPAPVRVRSRGSPEAPNGGHRAA